MKPTVARSYETAVAATITSTAGNAVLSATDTSTTAPGHLVNGTFSLPAPLNVRAVNTTNPTQAYAPLAETTGTQTNLLTYAGPVNQDVVTIGFRQAMQQTADVVEPEELPPGPGGEPVINLFDQARRREEARRKEQA